ncbi:MAG: histidinol dehydrogenase, partial [Cyanobacteria bacterium]|nr:histidinol dehydrogenase [Cyanobacteriota bacterium]
MPESSSAAFPLRCVRDVQQAEAELLRLTRRTDRSQQRDVRDRVDAIIHAVRDRGDAAVAEFTERFDGFDPRPMAVPEAQLKQAWTGLSDNLRDALDLAHRRISEFHQRQRPADIRMDGVHGEQLGRRWRPVQRAGLYVPGGRAAYPSTVLMNAVPARVAGVGHTVICSPAGADGQVNPVVLAAAHLAGVRTVLRIGGAQAIAAMAFGTESVAKVDVISGPGNIYVTLAKQAVYGQVGIDSLAGPSEVLVIADQSANPDQVASDLLAQAEHDPLASAVLITTDHDLAGTIGGAIGRQLEDHPRRSICEASLRDWGLVVVC